MERWFVLSCIVNSVLLIVIFKQGHALHTSRVKVNIMKLQADVQQLVAILNLCIVTK